MAVTEAVAQQIADLINSQNQLTVQYTAARILKHDDYIVRLNDSGQLLAVVEVKKVQWYQCEIDHLSVDPSAKRAGLGTALVQEAEARARELGARVAQCTIRVGNTGSERLFRKGGYTPTITFVNETNGNQVKVYQKLL